MTVCIISYANDVHAICVELALRRKGVKVVRWHWNDFPSASSLSLTVAHDGTWGLSGLDFPTQEELTLWVHRGLAPIPSPDLHPADIDFVDAEAFDMLRGTLVALSSAAFCVNPIDAARSIQSKINQLIMAGKCGLTIPPSLFSNDPVAIREFFFSHKGDVVVKFSNALCWESSADGDVRQAFTSKVSESQLSDDAQLASCPSIFQALVHKAFELRIVFMGDTIFPVRIDSQKKKVSIDWRKDYRGLPPCSVFELPSAELEKIKRFIAASGLRYGSIDIVVDKDDQYIFLEVNETGQFLWIEHILPELPLLNCFAEFLVSRDPHFRYCEGSHPVRFAEFSDEIEPQAIEQRMIGHVKKIKRNVSVE